jgi:hypothetical protein
MAKTPTKKAHGAKIHVLEKFALGIEISHANTKLGTIEVGQGTFAWRGVNTKTLTKTGKQPPSLSFSWSEFANLMNSITSHGKKQAQKKLAE